VCSSDLEAPASAGEEAQGNWQATLYFLLHLMPVDEVGRLLHQIRKWLVLERKGASAPDLDPTVLHTVAVLELYLDMHDAKFEGGATLIGTEPFRALFVSENGFNKMFAINDEMADRTIPRRGLREIMRFGHLPVLKQICGEEKITDAVIEKWKQAEQSDGDLSVIAKQQQKREELHEKYAKSPKDFSETEVKDYAGALAAVARHRETAAQVTLTNHVRAHRLMMAVFGRLADYAGLWERNLYFATLALIHQQEVTLAAVFDERGLTMLADMPIIYALSTDPSTRDAEVLRTDISRLFGAVHDETNELVNIRNNLAHLNMLQGGTLNLTEAINDTRRLMAHDRKLKNAVTQSIRELLAREGLELTWRMNSQASPHTLERATLETRQANHLQKTRGIQPRLSENFHGDDYVRMIATLFDGQARQKRGDITTLSLDSIRIGKDGGRTQQRKSGRKNRGKGHANKSK